MKKDCLTNRAIYLAIKDIIKKKYLELVQNAAIINRTGNSNQWN